MEMTISGGEKMDNNERNRNNERDRDDFNIGEMLIRVLVIAIVVAIAAYFTPGFTIDSIWSLLIAAVVIGEIGRASCRERV